MHITTLINAVQERNNDTSAFYIHFRSDFQDVSIQERNEKKKLLKMLLKTDDYRNQT